MIIQKRHNKKNKFFQFLENKDLPFLYERAFMEAPGDEDEPETEEQPEEEVETEETPDAEEGNTVDTTQNPPPENQQEEVYDDTVVGDADADEIADEEQTNPPNENAGEDTYNNNVETTDDEATTPPEETEEGQEDGEEENTVDTTNNPPTEEGDTYNAEVGGGTEGNETEQTDQNQSTSNNQEEGDNNTPGSPADFESMQKYTLFQKLNDLYEKIDSYKERMDDMIINTDEDQRIIEFCKNRLERLRTMVYDYMIIAFRSRSYEESTLFYQRAITSVQLIFNVFSKINDGKN